MTNARRIELEAQVDAAYARSEQARLARTFQERLAKLFIAHVGQWSAVLDGLCLLDAASLHWLKRAQLGR